MMTHEKNTTIAEISEAQPQTQRKQKMPLRPLEKETIPDPLTQNPVPKKYNLAAFSHRKLIRWASYRVPMKIAKGILMPFHLSATVYYVCPRCQTSIEREFISFCSRCGQKLDWRGYRKAKLYRPGKNSSSED